MRRRADREPVEWAVAARCRRGEATSGDLAIVTWLPDGALVAAVDGLGHGSEAARAAEAAGRVVRESPSRDLVSAGGALPHGPGATPAARRSAWPSSRF